MEEKQIINYLKEKEKINAANKSKMFIIIYEKEI